MTAGRIMFDHTIAQPNMSLNESLLQILTEPTPESLWQLRKELLAAKEENSAKTRAVLNEFFLFLNGLVASSTARQYSHFASLLDLGAVGGVAIQNLLDLEESDDWSQRLLVGGLSEVLMVLAARQYVKAWEEEMTASFTAAAWYLYGEFWQLSLDLQPELSGETRNALVEQLIAPLLSDEVSGTVKAAIIVHFYQLLLLAHFKAGL